MGLFTVPEIEYFHEVRGRTHRRNVPEDATIGRTLSGGVWTKTKKWANSVQKSTSGFTTSCRKAWQKSGWDDGRVAQIKPYTWARIFKPQDAAKGIYFTIGVDAGRQSILIKIHYQEQAREQAKALLTPAQGKLCERLIKSANGSFTYCQEIPLQQVDEYSLERLTTETIAFIRQYESTYDLIVGLVWPTVALPDESVPQTTPNTFEPGPGPDSVVTAGTVHIMPERTIQPALIHLQISLLLYKYLVDEHGFHNVRREWPTANNTIIDMVRQENAKLIFYEIKTYPSVRDCIREAVGQLLEYSYWPNQINANELIVVTPHPANQSVKNYMKNLRETFGLPIHYQRFDLYSKLLEGSKW